MDEIQRLQDPSEMTIPSELHLKSSVSEIKSVQKQYAESELRVCEGDLNEKVQSDPSIDERKCEHCRRVQRKILGIHVDRMNKV